MWSAGGAPGLCGQSTWRGQSEEGLGGCELGQHMCPCPSCWLIVSGLWSSPLLLINLLVPLLCNSVPQGLSQRAA